MSPVFFLAASDGPDTVLLLQGAQEVEGTELDAEARGALEALAARTRRPVTVLVDPAPNAPTNRYRFTGEGWTRDVVDVDAALLEAARPVSRAALLGAPTSRRR